MASIEDRADQLVTYRRWLIDKYTVKHHQDCERREALLKQRIDRLEEDYQRLLANFIVAQTENNRLHQVHNALDR